MNCMIRRTRNMPCTMNYENAKWTMLRTQDDSEQPIWVMLSSEQLARKRSGKDLSLSQNVCEYLYFVVIVCWNSWMKNMIPIKVYLTIILWNNWWFCYIHLCMTMLACSVYALSVHLSTDMLNNLTSKPKTKLDT